MGHHRQTRRRGRGPGGAGTPHSPLTKLFISHEYQLQERDRGHRPRPAASIPLESAVLVGGPLGTALSLEHKRQAVAEGLCWLASSLRTPSPQGRVSGAPVPRNAVTRLPGPGPLVRHAHPCPRHQGPGRLCLCASCSGTGPDTPHAGLVPSGQCVPQEGEGRLALRPRGVPGWGGPTSCT